MAHIILTGATGTTGSAVLRHSLVSPSINKISILSRRPVDLAENEPKAHVILHKDFEVYPQAVLDELRGADGCIWAQGISSNGMKEDDYTKITVDFPIAAAKAFSTLNDKFNFVYISGEGAEINSKSTFMFGRVKGRAERELIALQAKCKGLGVFNLRPATISPEGNYQAQRATTFKDRSASVLGAILSVVWKNMVTPVDRLAQVSVELAIGDGKPIAAGVGVEAEGRVLRNTAIRRMAGI